MTTPTLNQSLFVREDESLKSFLTGLVVTDAKMPNGRAVPVIYRMSEQELVKRDFPYVMIDSLGPVVESDREIRGVSPLPAIYLPDGATTPEQVTDFPIPLQLRYSISSNARNPRHDIQMLQQMMVLLIRFGAMNMVAFGSSDRFPAVRDDMSRRRIDVLAGPVKQNDPDPADDSGRMRIFRRVWTLGVSSEIFLSDLDALNAVQRVVIDPSADPTFSSLT